MKWLYQYAIQIINRQQVDKIFKLNFFIENPHSHVLSLEKSNKNVNQPQIQKTIRHVENVDRKTGW